MKPDDINHQVLVILLKKIIDLLGEKEEPIEEVAINNLDEVNATLHNISAKQTKSLVNALDGVSTESEKQTKIINRLLTEVKNNLTDNFTSVYIKKPIDQVEILNLEEIPVAENVKVSNLSELADYFDSLAEVIKGLDLSVNVSPPSVNVPAPVVNVPSPTVNVPEIDLSPILDELDRQLNKIRTNSVSRPLAVRLTDGQEWIKELRKQTAQTMQYMSDVSYVKNAAGHTINPATDDAPSTLLNGAVTVTTAGTEVQVSSSSTAIKSVTVKALSTNTGLIYVGNSGVTSANGYILSAGQAISFDIDNLNKVYLDSSADAQGARYLAVS